MQSDYSIPRTRITIPRRRGDLVTRQRLLGVLNELLEKKLALISAPAGYGKTSLLVDFSNNTELPVCWYTINSLDFEPQRFILNLIAAIGQRFPNFGERTRTALQNAQSNLDPDQIATLFINELYDRVAEHFVLVLDDYYLVNDCAQIRNFISRFLQDMDENCHVIITSRTLLSLPILPMMVARMEVGGLSFEELAFTVEEIQQLFYQNQNNLLPLHSANEILSKTEGWITGIILSTQLTPQGNIQQARLARVSGVGLEEYFLQLLDQQPDEIRDFLLRTSLLEEFNAERCEQVIGSALAPGPVNYRTMIGEVQRSNLFTLPVGEDGSWLRYHHLFLNFLQSRILRERPEETQAIERQLAHLYLENGDWDNAFALYRKLNLIDDLVVLVERAGPDLLVEGRISTLSAWLDALPSELLSTRPFIVALQGSVAATTGDTGLALTLFNRAVSTMKLPQDYRTTAYALVWRAGTHRLKNNLNASIADARETLGLIENDPDMRRVKAEAQRCIGICLRLHGKMQEALGWLNQALDTSLSISDKKNEAIIRLELGVLYENLGEYKLSKEMYFLVLDYWQNTGNTLWLSNLLNNLGVLQHITGDYQTAVSTFEKALFHARASGYNKLEAFILTGIGDIYGELDALEEALSAYQQARVIAQRIQDNFLLVYLNVQEVSLGGVEKFSSGGKKLLEEARTLASQDASGMQKSLCDLEYAGIKIREGDPQAAIRLLENACTYFESAGHKTQTEKANLYLALAYGQIGKREKLIEHVLKILAYLDSEYLPVSLIATASRFYDQLEQLSGLDYVENQLEKLFYRIEKFRKQLPLLRRDLRQQAVSIPFAPPTIYIRALGKMQVTIDNRTVTSSDWQTQAARDLFFLLLAHPEGMTRDEIGYIFWPDADPENIKFRIKNSVYRLRHAVGKDVILFDQDNYRFNNTLDYEYDVELLLRENALAQQAKDSLQKLSHFREAIKLCRGIYLPEIDETWVHAPREVLQRLYLNILLQVAELYTDLSNYDLALDYCQRALKEDDCLETAYRLSFRIYAAMGNRAAVVRQYQRCCEVLQREINAEPSPQTQALYQDLLK